ncbi:MAG: DUF3352 domain-containing protein [Chlorobi bacterium]|nr:DUF3352 domain-containing protein [Chlorobiota bacterium]
MKKFLKAIFIIILLGAGAFYAYIKFISPVEMKQSMTMVPDDAVMIIETENLAEAWTEISNSKVWNYLLKNPYFNDLNEDFEMLNAYLKDNNLADFMLKKRSMIMSLHMISARDWDFLFVVDLQNLAQIKKLGLKNLLQKAEGYQVKSRKYKDETIFELKDEANPSDVIFLTVSDNLLAVTFTGALLEKSIDEKNDNYWANNKNYQKVVNKLYGEELFRLFFNYSKIDEFSMSFLTEESEIMKMLGNSLAYTGFNIDLRDETLSFDGYTSADSTGSYVKALANIKPGKLKAWQILPKQTAMYFSMGFSDFFDFYFNLTKQYEEGNAEDMEDIKENIAKTERLLGISLHDDFFAWIGEEIAVAKLRPSKNTRPEDVIIVIPANDIDEAKAGLERIMKKIKRRTPLKFKPEDYKNFTIQSLEINGFFKLFLGKMFKDVEKPYFTFIEKNVVFSNSLASLKDLIDSYITGNTLANDIDFVNFRDEFANKANLTVFIKTPQIYQNLYYYSNAVDRKSIKENKEFILSFEKIGFQLSSEDEDMFKTLLLAKHNPDAVKTDELEQMETEITEDMFRGEVESLAFKINLPEDYLKLDTLYKEFYDGSAEKIKVEGLIHNGAITGNWKTYYESGNIKSSVNYTDGEPEGDAYFYYDTPDHTKRADATFEKGKITGTYFEYYENGAQKAKMQYDDGKPDGDAEFYYPSGKLKIKAEYKNGLKHGRWIYYDERGKPVGKEKWKKGERKKEAG